MKRWFMIFVLLSCVTEAFPQAFLSFGNNSLTALTNDVTGLPLPIGDSFVVGLYYAPLGTTNESGFVLVDSTTISYRPGTFNGGTVYLPDTTPPGRYAMFQVKAWSAGYPSYEALLGDPFRPPDALAGQSRVFTECTMTGFPPDPPCAAGVQDPFRLYPVGNVPEPSTLALVPLGIAAAALVGRRK
jgi:hypothetical protein